MSSQGGNDARGLLHHVAVRDNVHRNRGMWVTSRSVKPAPPRRHRRIGGSLVGVLVSANGGDETHAVAPSRHRMRRAGIYDDRRNRDFTRAQKWLVGAILGAYALSLPMCWAARGAHVAPRRVHFVRHLFVIALLMLQIVS